MIGRRGLGALAMASLLPGCSNPKAGEAVGDMTLALVTIPAMVVLVPLMLGKATLAQVDDGLRRGGHVTLDQAYQAVYNLPITSPNVDPVTGAVKPPARTAPRNIHTAQLGLDRLLRANGYDPNFQRYHYLLCEESAEANGRTWLLLSVVSRDGRARDPSLTGDQYYVANPRADTVLDWVALDQAVLADDKAYAFLFAAAAQAVIDRRTAPDYWRAAQQWHDGHVQAVVDQCARKAQAILAG